MRSILFALPLIVVASCATPESRVRTALLDAGLSKPISTCMAQRMVDRLSIGQLQRLSRLSGMSNRRIGDMTIGEFVRQARALGDPEIVAVVTTAGLGCAIAS